MPTTHTVRCARLWGSAPQASRAAARGCGGSAPHRGEVPRCPVLLLPPRGKALSPTTAIHVAFGAARRAAAAEAVPNIGAGCLLWGQGVSGAAACSCYCPPGKPPTTPVNRPEQAQAAGKVGAPRQMAFPHRLRGVPRVCCTRRAGGIGAVDDVLIGGLGRCRRRVAGPVCCPVHFVATMHCRNR